MQKKTVYWYFLCTLRNLLTTQPDQSMVYLVAACFNVLLVVHADALIT